MWKGRTARLEDEPLVVNCNKNRVTGVERRAFSSLPFVLQKSASSTFSGHSVRTAIAEQKRRRQATRRKEKGLGTVVKSISRKKSSPTALVGALCAVGLRRATSFGPARVWRSGVYQVNQCLAMACLINGR